MVTFDELLVDAVPAAPLSTTGSHVLLESVF